MSGLKDVFGGDDAEEARRKTGGHYWVGIGTSIEHCMICRRGPTDDPCDGVPYCTVCGEHLDSHHSDNRSQTETFLDAAKQCLDDTAYERLRKTMLEERPPKKDHDFVRKEQS